MIPLASCIAALLGMTLHQNARAATTHMVSSCADTGAGTLRAIVGDTVNTLSGDTIDFSNVAPCTVTLKTGAINITQNGLIIKAPADKRVTVTGKYGLTTENDRLIKHTGTGTLATYYLNFSNGSLTAAGPVLGGCIYSAGSVQVLSSDMLFCYAHSTDKKAGGGAIYAKKQVTMKYGRVVGGGVLAAGGNAAGGGVNGGTGVGLKYSTIAGNTVSAPGQSYGGFGGGVYTRGSVRFQNSTISGNLADFSAGGVFQGSNPSPTFAHIYSSTISGNTSSEYLGGALLSAGDQIVTNSTIAFNQSARIFGVLSVSAAGLYVYASTNPTTLKLQSTIISNNSYTGGSDYDMNVGTGFGSGTFSFDAASSNNLIHIPGAFTLPPNTTTTCPHLGRLRDNGGFTYTHQLTGHSVAIDHGINPKNFTTDQRGNDTLYPRVSGPVDDPNPQPDIGAYEVNQADIIFVEPFETCLEIE